MGRSTALMVVCVAVMLAATADVGRCREEESYAQQRAKESFQDEKAQADSWAEWIAGKVSGGLGLGQKDAAQNVIVKAGDAASKSTETMQSAASGTSKYASEKATSAANLAAEKSNQAMHKASDLAGNAKETIAETMGHGCGGEKAYYACNSASDMPDNARGTFSKVASDMAGDVRDRANDAYNYASTKTGETSDWGSDGIERVVGGIYGNGHRVNVNDVYYNKKDSNDDTYDSVKAREKYEAGKERESDKAGEVGEKMRNNVAEL